MFTKAVKSRSYLRLALIGPAGSGKTMWSQALAALLANRQPFAVIDTEHGSASKYADLHDFDTVELDDFHPRRYIEALKAAEAAKYPVCVVDSLSHAWAGKGGALALVDQAKKRGGGANSFNAWGDVTPIQNELIEAILAPRMHVICTMRAKQAYAQEQGSNGKTVIRKLGLEPVQREGLEYEFDIVGTLDYEHALTITKSRAPGLSDLVVTDPRDLAGSLIAWLADGAPVADPAPEPPPPDPAVPRKLKYWSRLNDLVLESKARGLKVDDAEQMQMAGEASIDEIVAMGRQLLAAIDAQKAAVQTEDADAELFPAGRP